MGIRLRSPFVTGRAPTVSRQPMRPPVHRARPQPRSRPRMRDAAPSQRGFPGHYPWESRLSDWTMSASDGRADYSRPFRNHPMVYRAISVKAGAAAAVELKLAKKNADGELEDVTSGIEYETLMYPSRDMSPAMMLGQIEGWMQMAPGEAFLWILRGGETARRLRLLSPEWIIEIKQQPDGSLAYHYRCGTEQEWIPEVDMIHFRSLFNPYEPNRGIGPLQAAALPYQHDLDVRQYNQTVVRAGGMPAGFMSVKTGWPTDDEITRFKEQLLKIQREQQKVVLVGDGTWQAAGQTPEEMAFIELRKLSFKEIGGVFGVPPQYLGDFERDQADAEVQSETLHVDTMRGDYRTIAGTFSMNLWKISGRQTFERNDRITVLLDDSNVPAVARMTARQQEVDLRKVDNSTITRNEFRKRWNEGDPLPWGDDANPPFPALQGVDEETSDDEKDTKKPPKKEDEGKAVEPEDTKALSLEQHAFRLNVAPYEQRLRYALDRIWKDLTDQIVARIEKTADAAPDQKAPVVSDESVRDPFSIAEIAAKVAHDTTPILRAAQRAGGLRGLKLARQYNQAFKVDARPAVEYLSRQVERFAVPETETTWNAVRDTLKQGIAKGEPSAQLVERVRKAMEVRRNQAATLAQTYANGAFNGGMDLGLTQSEVVLTKRWLKGANPRPAHAAAHGQEVAVGKDFVIGGEAAAFPGDPRLSDEQLYNCNCTLSVGKLAKA